jgi:hypothetical protein
MERHDCMAVEAYIVSFPHHAVEAQPRVREWAEPIIPYSKQALKQS